MKYIQGWVGSRAWPAPKFTRADQGETDQGADIVADVEVMLEIGMEDAAKIRGLERYAKVQIRIAAGGWKATRELPDPSWARRVGRGDHLRPGSWPSRSNWWQFNLGTGLHNVYHYHCEPACCVKPDSGTRGA